MSTIVLDLEADRVLAVEARVSGDRVTVARAFVAETPDAIAKPGGELSEPTAVGAWVKTQLEEAGFKAGGRGPRAIVAAGRGEVLVKRLAAPAADLNAAERHEMICLQMSRQASLTSASSVIDYVESSGPAGSGPSDSGDGEAIEGDARASLSEAFVVASAMPSARVSARRAMADAAGLKLSGIRLRSAGVRALVARELDAACPTLVICPGVGSVELLMLVGGEIAHSRSVALGLPDDEGAAAEASDATGAYAARVAVEADRTMVSFRVSAEGKDIERVVVLAGGCFGSALSEAVGDRISLPSQVLDPGSLIDFGDLADERLHAAIAPLAGLLLCKSRGIKVHDFANPTGPPDTTAAIRQVALACVFVLVVLLGAGFVFGQRAIGDAKAARDKAKEAHDEAQQRWVASQLDGARLGHLAAFAADEIDWPAHLAFIMSLLPDADSVALGQIGVGLDRAASFEQGGTLGDPDSWGGAGAFTLTISGVSRDRDHITRFRERLLETGLYTVTSQGPEVEDRFVLRIATAVQTPRTLESSPPESDSQESAGSSGVSTDSTSEEASG